MIKKYLLPLFFLSLLGCSNEPEISLPIVEKVDVNNDERLLLALGKPKKVIESTDSLDAPKKIYQFDDLSQAELSKNYILLSWQRHNKASMDRAVIGAMSALGDEGGYFIHEVDRLGQVDKRSINGHDLVNNMCISESCMVKITR